MTDLRSTIPALIARRGVVGADSFEGKRLSTLIEQIDNGVSPVPTIAEIADIRANGYQPPDFAAMIAEGRHLRSHSKGAM